MFPCIALDWCIAFVADLERALNGKKKKKKCEVLQPRSHLSTLYNCMLLHFSKIPDSCQLHQIRVQYGKVCLKRFCQNKRLKDHFSSADSMNAGWALRQKSLLNCTGQPQSWVKFILSLWSKMWTSLVGFLLVTLRAGESGVQQSLPLARSSDTTQGSLGHVRNGS